MEPGILTRYSASAGSGKTYELAAVYLKALFRDPLAYRGILAVTFTNKATAEMKERILHNLYLLAGGYDSEYSGLLALSAGKSEKKIREEAKNILNNILHDYSRFSIGTIDSFFQKVLRAFARESGLQAGFNVILDSKMILLQSVDALLRDAEADGKLLNWLIEFGQREITEGKSWNLKNKILELGEEIFKEKYRLLHESSYINEDRESLGEAIRKIMVWKADFRKQLSRLAARAVEILDMYGVEQDILYLKSRSVRKFLEMAVDDIPDISFAAMKAAVEEGRYFSGKKVPEQLEAALSNGLKEAVTDVAELYLANTVLYNSVNLVTGNLYSLGILNDIALKTRRLLAEQNKFLLSDAGDILRRIISMDQTPFIYEKMGNRYRNFMIDEFQDTSKVQWDNFLPLISNSIAEGEDCLVVGDIKQSIYRWRNSDWKIFDGIGGQFHPESFKTVALKKNWRSSPNIIKFNNSVFSALPGMIEKDIGLNDNIITGVYSDVEQEDPGKFSGGYIKMKIYDRDENNGEIALDELPSLIEEIQDMGYKAGDIGILVRTRKEGQKVIERITSYASERDGNNTRYSYRIISQDSLMLGSSPVVLFLISVLRYMIDSNNRVNSSVMYQYYLLAVERKEAERLLFIDGKKPLIGEEKSNTDFNSFLDSIRYLSVYEIIDRLIEYGGLDKAESAAPYLNTLQNSVLEFAGNETNDIPAFLEWWDSEGNSRSVSSTEQDDAMQLMTIHKSKGLQFRVVVLPFVSWTFSHEVNPVLWIYSEHRLLSPLGAVPVRMKKDFRNTLYEKFYLDELGKAAIDKLNMLYVAFTRARECLYGNLLTGKKGKTAGSYLLGLFSEQATESEIIFRDHWDEENRIFCYGEKPGQINEKDIPEGPAIGYPLFTSGDRLRLKLHSKRYYSADRNGHQGKRQYGLMMHEILSTIEKTDDVEAAVGLYLRKGIINGDEYKLIYNKISKALEEEPVKSWFSGNIRVRNETDILIPGGKIRRPDRIIMKDNKIIVIDFKFGEELNSHRRQILEYKDIMEQMGYAGTEAWLWYFDVSKTVKV